MTRLLFPGRRGRADRQRVLGEGRFPFQLIDGFRKLDIAGLMYDGLAAHRGSRLLAGFLSMEIARSDPSVTRSTARTPAWPWAASPPGLGGAEAALAAADGPAGEDRGVRADRADGASDVAGGLETTARRDGDRWVLNGAKRGSVTVRSPTWSSSGPATLTTTRSRGRGREGDTRLQHDQDGGQAGSAHGAERRYHAGRLRGRRGSPVAAGQLVRGHRGRAPAEPGRGGLGVGGPHACGLRAGAGLRQGAGAVRLADRRVPAGAGPPGDHAG